MIEIFPNISSIEIIVRPTSIYKVGLFLCRKTFDYSIHQIASITIFIPNKLFGLYKQHFSAEPLFSIMK